MKATITWDGGMAFSGEAPSGHKITMDTKKDFGGQNLGPTPMELLLFSLPGCTGIDIVSILNKMRLNLTSFQMEVEGIRAKEHPKRFTTLNVHYILEGDLPEEKVVRAIQLSTEKYCSVSHTLNAAIHVSCTLNGTKLDVSF